MQLRRSTKHEYVIACTRIMNENDRSLCMHAAIKRQGLASPLTPRHLLAGVYPELPTVVCLMRVEITTPTSQQWRLHKSVKNNNTVSLFAT